MIGLILLGVVAYVLLPIAGVPQVDIPTVRVTANLPGANAETMATSVATPLERQFTLISGVTAMSSTSLLGKTQIQIEFDLSRNPDAAAQDVQAAITAAGGDLPKTLTAPPFYEKVNPADFQLMSIAVTSPDLPMAKIDEYVENYITPQLSRLAGVGLIDYQGQQKPAIRVQIDPAVASAMDISLEDVRAAIATTTVDAPKGLLDGTKQSLTLDTTDQVFDARTFNSAVIAYRKGAPVRVADLGRAIDGPETIRSAAWLNGEPAAIIDIHKQPGLTLFRPSSASRMFCPSFSARYRHRCSCG
jgi:multidrug efflux pump